ncbi:MAG TPA: PKD domain-containing protein [Pyrinomonadaceae bacterium]|nr:PKD domain-containing protein [Pyrinomonadaceae bacterium]
MNKKLNSIALSGLFLIICLAATVNGATTLPILWTGGGLSAGSDSAGQAARMTTDASGNIAIVSGPSLARGLGVTSYTSAGVLRWQKTVNPVSGTYTGLWISAAPNGDFVALGANVDSRGSVFGSTLVRYSNDGTLLWKIDSTELILSIGRLLVDANGNAYVQLNSKLYKYSAAGTLVWTNASTGVPNGGAALSPDGADIVLTGAAGGNWRIGAFDTATGINRWLVVAPEGISANDVVIDNGRVYVAGQGVTGASTPQLAYFLTVIAYDQANGTRLWRTDKNPVGGTNSAGLRIAKAPDGSLVATGQTLRGFLDWYTVAFETTGAVRWETIRDGGLNTDEIPRSVFVLPNGTTVVTGTGGPALPGGFIQGVTAGYNANGLLLWEGFSRQATVWATPLPSGDVCATGGYDALVTCFDAPSTGFPPLEPVAIFTATPTSGNAPLTVAFDGRASLGANQLATWSWTFGDGATGSGSQVSHLYSAPGKYTASLVVTDILGLTSFPRTVSIVVNAAPPTLPTAPTNLVGTTASRSSIRLNWTNSTTDQTEVKIERCKGATCINFAQIASVSGTAATHTDTGLANGTSYRYRVRSANAVGNSPYSAVITAKTSKR